MQPAIGIQDVGQPEEVALVGAAAVVEDEQPIGVAAGGPLEMGEYGHRVTVVWGASSVMGRAIVDWGHLASLGREGARVGDCTPK